MQYYSQPDLAWLSLAGSWFLQFIAAIAIENNSEEERHFGRGHSDERFKYVERILE